MVETALQPAGRSGNREGGGEREKERERKGRKRFIDNGFKPDIDASYPTIKANGSMACT